MPLSPLIRPLSPLQTQFAPLLPEPCSLADAVLRPIPAEAPATLTGAWDQGTSSAAGVVHSPPVTMPAPAPPPLWTRTLAPTFHSMVGEAVGVEVRRDSYAAQLQRNFQQRPVVDALRGTPDGAAAGVGSHLSSDAVTAQTITVDDTNHFEPLRRALLSSRASTLSVHPYVSATTARAITVHKKRADEPSPAATRLSLLHSAATTAVAAARPSYGVALLRNCSPAKPEDQKELYRSRLTAQRDLCRSSSQSIFKQRAQGRREVVSPTSSLSSCDCASTAVDSVERDPCKPYATMPFTAPATRCHGTAASDRTACSRTVSIAMCPASRKSGTSAAASDCAGSGARKSKALVFSACVSSALSSAHARALGEGKVEALAGPPCCAPHCVCLGRDCEEKAVDGEESEKFFDSPRVLANEGLQAMQPEPSAGLLRKAAPGKQGTTTGSAPRTMRSSCDADGAPEAAAATSPAVEPYSPRYIYPALEECRRLLDEIRIVSPLLRRCLTSPRPLESSSDGGDVTTATSAPSTFSPVRVPARDTPASSQSSTSPSRFAVTTAVVPPMRGNHAPRPEARRLYDWDAAPASEDLSFMRGSFQQSTERFATSVTRQLHRLQAVGTRLYGKTHDTWASRAEVYAPSRRSRSLPSSVPLTSSWGSAAPHSDVDQHDREDNTIKESPSRRLRRLLRETEAALPSLLGHKAEPPLFVAPIAVSGIFVPSTINHARSHSTRDSTAAARAAGVSVTSMESTFPFSAISESWTLARPPMPPPLPYGD